MCLYKSETHALNYCKLKLSADIEKNPGPRPMYVDPSKTIAAPYSRDNELLFGQNAGQQCVTMSSCSLIYNNKQGISSANDLIQIMNIGNQLYSSLSQLDRYSYLMQTELPTMLNALDTNCNYQLEFSESYTGIVRGETAIEGYQYCTSLQIAFELLLSRYYTSFILTVGCIGVSIHCNGDIGFKIFDSHARDVYGRAHSQGACVLLETLSLDSLVCYLSWQGWLSGESTCLPPIWPGLDFRTRCHMWIEFVGSLLCHERFSPGYSGFPLSSKTNI